MSVVGRVGLYSVFFGFLTVMVGLIGFLYAQLTSDRVNIATTTFTAISIQFLVYDRLRNSALTKLDFLNRKSLTPAMRVAGGTIQTAGEDEANNLSKSREICERHGRFLRIKLYPNSFLKTVSDLEMTITEFRKVRERIEEAGYKVWGRQRFNLWVVFIAAGLMDQGNYTSDVVGTHKEFFESLKTSDPDAWKGFPELGSRIIQQKAGLAKKIDEFFIDNQLEAVKDEPNPFEASRRY